MSGGGHQWQEISDLSDELRANRDRELESLYGVWDDQRKNIGDTESIRDFSSRLAREWAIETGIIEGVYTLDRGITQTLIERGIDASYIPHDATNRDPELTARIIQAHSDVLEGLFAFVKGERDLTVGYIKELHAALLRYQDTVTVFDQFGKPFEQALEKGAYKKLPNNPQRSDGTIHEYCPPEHVASEMDRLVALHKEHEKSGVPAHVEAAWLHHAFTQIHPFQDGNGRVARSLASLVLLKKGYFPLVVTRDDREKYIDALEAADQGELPRLADHVSALQKRALMRAIGKLADMKPAKTLEEALDVTRDLLVNTGRMIPADYLLAKEHSELLADATSRWLTIAANRLRNDIARANSEYQFQDGSLATPPLRELRWISDQLGYDPNVTDVHRSLSLSLDWASTKSEIVFSFHGVGAAFCGLAAVVAYFQTGAGDPVLLAQDIFPISYKDNQNELKDRYMKWLEACLVEGLAQWRRALV